MKFRKKLLPILLTCILSFNSVLPAAAVENPDSSGESRAAVEEVSAETSEEDPGKKEFEFDAAENRAGLEEEPEAVSDQDSCGTEDGDGKEKPLAESCSTAEISAERKASSGVDISGTSIWLSDYTYTVNNGFITLTSYKGTDTEVTVPGNAYVNNTLYRKISLTARMWGESVQGISFEQGVVLPADSSGMFAAQNGTNSGLVHFNGKNLDTSSVTSMRSMFQGCRKLESVSLNGFNTSSVKDMSYMFSDCSLIGSLDLSGFDTSSVTEMYGMFYNCRALSSLNINGFNTKSVTNMGFMFGNCSSLTELSAGSLDTSSAVSLYNMFNGCSGLIFLDLSGFNTEKAANMTGLVRDCKSLTGLNLNGLRTSAVTEMSYMFSGCEKLENLDVSSFDTSHVTNMKNMFENCRTLKGLDLKGFNTARVTTMEEMFSSCSSLASLDISSFNTASVTSMSSMFKDCGSLSSINVSRFNTSSVTNMSGMFEGCSSLFNMDLSSFNTSSVKNMSSMFSKCTSLLFLDVSSMDTSSASDLSNMFFDCSSLTGLDVRGFKTSAVTDMSGMFYGCSGLTGLDLRFDTAAVTNMAFMFYGCSGLTRLDLIGFNTSHVTDMTYMFYGCSGLTELIINSFNTSSVRSMGGMFSGCSSLTSLLTGGLDTGSVTDMFEMFCGCSGLTELDVFTFDTSAAVMMRRMFADCSGLTSLDVSSFDTSSVKDMGGMFSGCSGLTSLDISNFDTSAVMFMESMFSGCSGLTELDLKEFKTSAAGDMERMFYGCSSLTSLDLSSFDTGSVSSVKEMFYGCSSLTYLDLSSFDLSFASMEQGLLPAESKSGKMRIRTPRDLYWEVSLPDGGTFYDQNGSTYGKLPENSSSSILLVENGKVSFLSDPEDAEAAGGEVITFSADFEGVIEYGIWQYKEAEGNEWKDYRRETVKENLQTLVVQASPEWNGRSVRLALFDAWGQQRNSTEAVITLGDGQEEESVEKFSYSFSNSRSSFGYPEDYHIPLSSYQIIYGDNTRAEAIYSVHARNGWGGNCAGMSATSALLTTAGSGMSPDAFKAGASPPKDLSAGDTSSSLSMNLTKFIEAMHIAQYTLAFSDERKANRVYSSAILAGNANLDSLYSAVKGKAVSGIPTVLAMVQDESGHAVLAYKAEEVSESEARIYIYDSNDPLKTRYITLKKNGGHYNEWSYDMGSYGEWGTDSDSSSISYISYATIKSIWDSRGNIGKDEANLAIVNSQNFAVYDVQGRLEAIVSDGVLFDRTGKISLIENELSLNGGRTEDVILSLPTKAHTITNLDREISRFSVNVVDTDLGVNIETTVQEVTISVDDAYNINTLVMDAGENDTYSVTLSSSFAAGYDEVVVNGKGQGETLSISQSGTSLNFSNCDISLLMVDGKQVGVHKVEASATKGGSIDPRGTASVQNGASATYTITPDDGYDITAVYVDGENIGKVTSYTFTGIAADHTILAAFEKKTAALSGTIRASLASDGTGTAVTTAPSGTKVLISAEGAGGSAPYTYKFLIYDNGAKTWYKLRDFTSTSTYTWTPGVTGTKTLFVDVKDSAGTTCRAKLSGFVVTEKQTALSGTVKASLASDSTGAAVTTAPSGSKVLITAKGAGGSGGYTYKFLIYDNGAKTWYKFRDFTSTNTYTWTPGVTGTKTLFVDIKDSAGTTVRVKLSGFVVTEKQTALSGTVKASLASDSTGASITTAPGGTKVLITAKGSGGSGSYTYKFLIYDNGTGAWFKLRDFTATNTYTWTTGATGTKTLFVDIMDSAGTVYRAKLSGFVVKVK